MKQKTVLPGFGPTLGFTIFYLSVLVLIPLAMLFIKTSVLSWPEFWKIVTHPRVMAAYRLSFTASFFAATVNVIFGFIIAWVLVRYSFPGKALIDVLVDLPFALPTAVAGITLTTLYSDKSFLGSFLKNLGVKVNFTPVGVTIALIFIGLPFVVRTVQPVLQDLDLANEEAAVCLGANRRQTFFRVILPTLIPAILTGFTMAFARALGEYGSIVFISGNLPFKTEIPPFLIITKLEQYDYAGATAIAVVLLVLSFILLFGINVLQSWAQTRQIKS